MYVDVKVTVWQRIQLNEDESLTKEQVIEELDLMNVNSLWDLPGTDVYFETLVDTEEYMPPEENDGQSTIELYDDESNLLWDNSIKKEE